MSGPSLKIGMVCHGSMGGSGVVATALGHALARRGHQVHFFSAGSPPRLEVSAPNVRLHTVEDVRHALFPEGQYALALASCLAREGALLDLIHVHYAIPHASSAMLARHMLGRRAPRLITTLHGTDVLTLGRSAVLQPVVRHSVASSDVVTVPTKYLRDEAEKTFGVSAEVIGNFVDTEQFKPSRSRSPHPKTLLHNSSFRALKRVDDVVRVFASVRERWADARLVLIGDGPERPKVEALATALNVRSAVTFIGERADVPALLQASDVFILPSETESFGLAALEALACGVPVIATRTGGLPELVDDGVTGYLLPIGDVAGMAKRVHELFEHEETWARFSRAARAMVTGRWQPEPHVALYEAAYRRALGT